MRLSLWEIVVPWCARKRSEEPMIIFTQLSKSIFNPQKNYTLKSCIFKNYDHKIMNTVLPQLTKLMARCSDYSGGYELGIEGEIQIVTAQQW